MEGSHNSRTHIRFDSDEENEAQNSEITGTTCSASLVPLNGMWKMLSQNGTPIMSSDSELQIRENSSEQMSVTRQSPLGDETRRNPLTNRQECRRVEGQENSNDQPVVSSVQFS